MTQSKRTILIVEDNPDSRQRAAKTLRYSGYAVLEALDGKQGMEIAKDKKPDIILMDVNMPEMNGLDATRQLKFDESTSGIPIIMLTSLDDEETQAEAREAGCNGYLTKPLTLPFG